MVQSDKLSKEEIKAVFGEGENGEGGTGEDGRENEGTTAEHEGEGEDGANKKHVDKRDWNGFLKHAKKQKVDKLLVFFQQMHHFDDLQLTGKKYLDTLKKLWTTSSDGQ